MTSMMTSLRLYPVYGTHEGGKFHVAVPIGLVPNCGAPGTIDTAQRIDVEPFGRVHPLVCKRCLAHLKKSAKS